MAGSPPNLYRMVSRWTCIQGVLRVRVKIKGHVIRALSRILGMSYSVIEGLVLLCLCMSCNFSAPERTTKRDPHNASALGRSKLLAIRESKCAHAWEIAVCNAVFLSTISCFVPEIGAIKLRSWHIFYVLWPPNFWGIDPKFLIQFGSRSNVSKFGADRLSDLRD